MNSCIGRTAIEEKVRMKLWAISGGRCEMCNKLLYEDSTFGIDGNYGEMAHIHAVSDRGPRNKRGMTPEEKNNIENLMLLCSEHHHMIDTKPDEFGDGLLKRMKKNHEERIRRVTDISEEESCRIVSYFSNVDNYEEFSSERLFKEALLFSGKLPMQQPPINLNANTYVLYEPSKEEFTRKAENLEREFKVWFDEIIKKQDSVGLFSLAPQPLLFKLGSLINDQYNVSVYQCHRRPSKWTWLENDDKIDFEFLKTLSNNDDEKQALELVQDGNDHVAVGLAEGLDAVDMAAEAVIGQQRVGEGGDALRNGARFVGHGAASLIGGIAAFYNGCGGMSTDWRRRNNGCTFQRRDCSCANVQLMVYCQEEISRQKGKAWL